MQIKEHMNLVRFLDHMERKVPKYELTQNKGKENENSYQKLKRSRWTGTRTHTRKQN